MQFEKLDKKRKREANKIKKQDQKQNRNPRYPLEKDICI